LFCVAVGDGAEEEGGQGLDHHIADGDGGVATGAFAFEEAPAEERNIMEPFNGCLAAGTK
jgi:hypothetical protein